MSTRSARGGVLVVGGGFAGSWVARNLGKRGATIVSPDNFMLYTPLLPEAASGMLEPRHVVVPLRVMCPHADLLLGQLESVDAARSTATVSTAAGPLEITYKQLVLAPGAVTRLLPIPGLAEHGLGFKSLADAIHLRNHVLRRLEAADASDDPAELQRQLTFVFVGAGYAGVEALAELADLVSDAVRFYPALQGTTPRWVLVDAAPRILGEVPSKLGSYAARQLSDRGVDVRVSTTLERVEEDGTVVLSDGARLPTATLVWTAGVKANTVLTGLDLPLDERGRVRVDEHLRVVGHGNVWALGDAANVPNRATPSHPDPPTCQHALRQARRLAANLAGPPRPYRYRMLGQVATLGRYRGIADVMGWPLRGIPGWFFTRSYHLYQLPLWSRRLRVVTDWTVSLFFRRDVAELGSLGTPAGLADR
jgi:NADH dehydrogenase